MMKKIFAPLAVLLLCAVLSGCSAPEPPEESIVLQDLNRYYAQADYTLAGENEPVGLISADSVEIVEREVDGKGKTARVLCRAQTAAQNGSFCRKDVWELWYTYDKSSKQWEFDRRECLQTDYELLSDLPEDLCLQLLSGELREDCTFASLTTDRGAKTATAVYTYESETAKLASYGTVTLHAEVEAFFQWDSDSGWQYTESILSDRSEYVCDLRCHITYDGREMLYTDQFNMEFDLVVIDNMVCIENLYYQGSVCTLGTLHIGNAEVVAIDDGTGVQIVFDYVRDAENVEEEENYIGSAEYESFYKTISGTGTVTIRTGEDGTFFAELFLPGFIAWHNDVWSDFQKGGIALKPVGEKTWNQFGDDQLPTTESVPTVPTPEVDIVTGGEERTENACAGEWTFTAPAGSGVSGSIEARLEEDGTCFVYCRMNLISLRDDTTYRLVESIADLPEDLLDRAVAGMGNVPEISVVYDAERDILITCLEKGTYIYFSRTGSGGSGGIYQPE